jgi:hypothetical protein
MTKTSKRFQIGKRKKNAINSVIFTKALGIAKTDL